MLSIVHDLRIALRRFGRDRAFTVTALLTLAVALGANAAMLAVVSTVLWSPLPVPDADELVTVYNQYPGAGVPFAGSSVPHFDERKAIDAVESAAILREDDAAVGEGSRARRVTRRTATVEYFDMLRTEARLGRTFTAEDGEEGAAPVVVLTDTLWREQFGGATDVLGKDLRIDGDPHEVIGVLPPGHQLDDPDIRLYTAATFSAEERAPDRRHSNNWQMIARLAPGATVEQAQQQVDALVERDYEDAGDMAQTLRDVGFRAGVERVKDVMVGDIESTLYLLWGGVLAVLLIAVVNLTNLTLARTSVRLKELVTRSTLGAGTAGLWRQLAVESVSLALVGGLLGVACGQLGLRLLGRLGMDEIPRGSEIALEPTIALATLGLALLIGLVLAAVPAIAVGRADTAAVLREEGRSGTASRGARRVRQGLVAAQVAFAFVLLAGAGLLFASFQQLLAVDLGFHPDDVLMASVSLPSARYQEAEDLAAFADRTLEQIRRIPGVESAGLAFGSPLSGSFDSSVILAEGWRPEPGESVAAPTLVSASSDYLEALDVELLEGRLLEATDVADSQPVALVDRRLAKRFWGEESPLGRRLFFPDGPDDLFDPGPDPTFITVVGVVDDMVFRRVAGLEMDDVGAAYFPWSQRPRRNLAFAVESALGRSPLGLSQEVRERIQAVDPELPVFDVATLQQRVDRSLSSRRMPMLLGLGFGAVALLLAAIGLYGVLAYLVARRGRELGIRAALGSTARALFALVVREGLVIVAAGLAVGLLGAVLLRDALSGELYGVEALDPLVLGVAVATLAAVAFLACAVPALRASRVDPSEALHD